MVDNENDQPKIIEYKNENDQPKTTEYKTDFNMINSSTSLNNPSEFITVQNPLVDLNESNSAIIHIKNTCKNSVFNCYVNCCFGHSVIYNTFIKTGKSQKYLFQNIASITPDCFTLYLKENVELLANFKSFTKTAPEEIQTDKGNLFAEMIKNDEFNCCNRREEILMPVNIISENRIAGIVKLVYNKDICLCPCFPCYQCDICCPNCELGSCCDGCDCNCCKEDPTKCCCGLCPRPQCCCCDPNRCCCGLCPRPQCCCCDPNRCCCGLCPKSEGCCCCPCSFSFSCKGLCNCALCKWFPYCAEILDINLQLKYYVFNTNRCSYCSKCLKRRIGLDFNICDINKNPICTIIGRNNKNFGEFFDDSYSYEINFPIDANPDIKLTILNCVYALDGLCVY